MFASSCGAPLSQRNVQRRALTRAAHLAGIADGSLGVCFHDLRHTLASRLIIDLRLDVVQVSWILGHASVSTTLDVYAHVFDQARHSADVRRQMALSVFAGLLAPTPAPDQHDGKVTRLPPASGRRCAGLLDQNLTTPPDEYVSERRLTQSKSISWDFRWS